MCFGIEDVDERKRYRGRRDACTYMRSTSGQPYALTAIFAWKERHSPSPVSMGWSFEQGEMRQPVVGAGRRSGNEKGPA